MKKTILIFTLVLLSSVATKAGSAYLQSQGPYSDGRSLEFWASSGVSYDGYVCGFSYNPSSPYDSVYGSFYISTPDNNESAVSFSTSGAFDHTSGYIPLGGRYFAYVSSSFSDAGLELYWD